MKMRLPALFLTLGVALTAGAAAPSPPAVVKARCSVCHGDAGETASEDFPRLSGQHETYLAKQLRDFQAGKRTGLMVRQAKGLSDADITAIARYFAAQPVPAPTGAPSEKAAAGRSIYLNGKPASGVPACMACHGEAAHGTPQLPRLAGQHADYLERQLKDFNLRKRTNDNAVMHEVAENLTPAEMRALAEYLASLR
jgi:cytochrome c553